MWVVSTSCKNECRVVKERFDSGAELIVHIYPDCSDTTRYKRIVFFEAGLPASEGARELGQKVGRYKSWYANGQQEADWEVLDNAEHGLITCWYDNGKVKKVSTLKRGVEEGLFKSWYDDGHLDSEGEFDKGKKNGLWKYWTKDGLLTERTYKDGSLNGPTFEVLDDGRKVRGLYRNGKEQGKWVWVDSLDRLNEIAFYDEGLVDSVAIGCYPNGQVREKHVYKKGKLISAKEYPL